MPIYFMGSKESDRLYYRCPNCDNAADFTRYYTRERRRIWRCHHCGYAWVPKSGDRGVLLSPEGKNRVGVTII